MQRWRDWIPRVLIESALIVFSILLALAVDGWREERERAQQVALALTSIDAELRANRVEIDTTQRYHRMLADTMFRLDSAGVPQISDAIHPKGIVRVPDVTATAWQSAQASGTTAHMPHATVLALARAYEAQAEYLRWRDAVMQNIHSRVLVSGPEAFTRDYVHMAGSISDLAHWERRVLIRYDSALARLGG